MSVRARAADSIRSRRSRRKMSLAHWTAAALLLLVTLPSLAGLTFQATEEPGFTLNVCHPLDGWTVAPAVPAGLPPVSFLPEPPRIKSELIPKFVGRKIAGPSLTPPVPPPESRA